MQFTYELIHLCIYSTKDFFHHFVSTCTLEQKFSVPYVYTTILNQSTQQIFAKENIEEY